jgi:hypothetical protein
MLDFNDIEINRSIFSIRHPFSGVKHRQRDSATPWLSLSAVV